MSITPKVALVYDKVNTPFGGAENVLQALNALFPEAPIYTALYHKRASRWTENIKIIPSFLQKTGLSKFHQLLTPLFPVAFEQFDFSEYDIVISVTSSQAKGILTKPGQLHINYLLTPTRYLFSHKKYYQKSSYLLGLPVFKQLFSMIRNYLTKWDYMAAYRPDYIIPISDLVGERTEQYYDRKPQETIYPTLTRHPLPTHDTLNIPQEFSGYGLVVSRLVPYKRVDIAIQASLVEQKPLIIVGSGTDLKRLVTIAGTKGYIKQKKDSLQTALTEAALTKKSVIFLRNCHESEIAELHAQASCFFMIGKEDYGITGLEAFLYGTPVILHQKSGVAEMLTETLSVNEESVDEVRKSMRNLPKSKSSRRKTNYNKKFASIFEKTVYHLWHHHNQKQNKDIHELFRS